MKNNYELALELLSLLNDKGFNSYIIGGAVRDKLLGIELNDIDIATNALPSDIIPLFETRDTGSKYNSIVVIYKDNEYELTTFRKELEYNDFRHPIFEVVNTLEEDVIRRDFTINALAINKDGKVIDLTNGLNDLNNKILKTIKDEDITFTEDPLRILRGIYFASKLDFTFDKKTHDSICKNAYLLKEISKARITQELFKMINTNNTLYINLLIDTKISNILDGLKEPLNYLKENNITPNIKEFLTITFLKGNIGELEISKNDKKNIIKVVETYKDFSLACKKYELDILLKSNQVLNNLKLINRTSKELINDYYNNI